MIPDTDPLRPLADLLVEYAELQGLPQAPMECDRIFNDFCRLRPEVAQLPDHGRLLQHLLHWVWVRLA